MNPFKIVYKKSNIILNCLLKLFHLKYLKQKKTIYQNISLKKGKQLLSKNIPNIVFKSHSCAPIALHSIFTDIPESKLLDAFYHCCNQWPNGGVTNKEFNIVIKFLSINNLLYLDKETTIDSLLKRKGDIFIALVYGHYLAISYGKVLEFYDSFWKDNLEKKVYCYWLKT